MSKPYLLSFCFILFTSCLQASLQQKAKMQKLMDARELIEATRDNNIQKVKELLEKGVNPNMAYGNGDTAAHIAIRNEYIQIFELLKKHKANLSLVNDNHETPESLFEKHLLTKEFEKYRNNGTPKSYETAEYKNLVCRKAAFLEKRILLSGIQPQTAHKIPLLLQPLVTKVLENNTQLEKENKDLVGIKQKNETAILKLLEIVKVSKYKMQKDKEIIANQKVAFTKKLRGIYLNYLLTCDIVRQLEHDVEEKKAICFRRLQRINTLVQNYFWASENIAGIEKENNFLSNKIKEVVERELKKEEENKALKKKVEELNHENNRLKDLLRRARETMHELQKKLCAESDDDLPTDEEENSVSDDEFVVIS